MKILYALQGTGNGHLSRARELVPLFNQYAEVDVLVSGTHGEVALQQQPTYQLHGMGFIFGKEGGVAIGATLKQLKPLRFIRDIWQLPIKSYDLIVNDFEPVSAYAAKRMGHKIHALSHQAAFLSSLSPRPAYKKDPFAEWLFKHYAPAQQHTAFHFSSYDHFIHTPIIRQEIRRCTNTFSGHVTVYLPAYDDQVLIAHFVKVKEVTWHLFSKHAKSPMQFENVWIRPVDNHAFIQSFAAAEGLLTGGGFESPAEALFMGKRLFVIPMLNQYEQHCNAEALLAFGAFRSLSITHDFHQMLRKWIDLSPPKPVYFADASESIVRKILGV